MQNKLAAGWPGVHSAWWLNRRHSPTAHRLDQAGRLACAIADKRTSRLDALLEGDAVCYHVTAEVDGRPFEFVTVDVGFGDPPPLEPDVLRGPDVLSFADTTSHLLKRRRCRSSSTWPRRYMPTRGSMPAVG